MKYLLLILSLCIWNTAVCQTTQNIEQIRAQMAKIRQSTNWDDPAAAAKANEEIKKLAAQLSGKPQVPVQQQSTVKSTPATFNVKTPASQENVLAIADRFFKRSYKKLDAISKSQFDQDFKTTEQEKFSPAAVKKLTSMGAMLITFGNDHNLACVYLTAALKALPADTLSVNNFGGYLRVIDSTAVSLPVLLYANKLFDKSPVILTQIGCSYMELKDYKQAESYLKKAVEINPDFGQAHSALCDLYLAQNRLQDAILELFAGVKGMGVSYSKASQNYAYMQQQAENTDTKQDFWDETRNRLNPDDALAPLVPEDKRIKMPKFQTCPGVTDWMEGGGYAAAVQVTNGYVNKMISFSKEFLKVQKQVPALPPNAILRDFPNERFALDCILEYFFHESDKESKNYQGKIDGIMEKLSAEADDYYSKREQYTNEFVSCTEGCGNDQYCIDECHRVYCSKECPAANRFNLNLDGYFKDYQKAFQDTKSNQDRILDDLYAFTGQWFSKIESEYWSRIYAYEIQRVALSIVGNTYAAYSIPFIWSAHNDCGTDCSLYANPFPYPPDEVEENTPKANNCPQDSKLSVGIAFCSMEFECESVEFGCSLGLSVSYKKNFQNKSTTAFIGVGVEESLGGAKAGAKAGFTVTKTESGDTDLGVKAEVGVSAGVGPVSKGKSYEFTASVMEGSRMEGKNVYGIGF
ncbi:MAG: tetratricopeptide repeat protein [Draconibacterium sp.]|nr:tetratricopeptide repeat protein [Draconibacterium sp.]